MKRTSSFDQDKFKEEIENKVNQLLPSNLNSPLKKKPRLRKSVDLSVLFFANNTSKKRNSLLLSVDKLKRKLSLFSASSKQQENPRSPEPDEEEKLDKADLTPSQSSEDLSSSLSSKSPLRENRKLSVIKRNSLLRNEYERKRSMTEKPKRFSKSARSTSRSNSPKSDEDETRKKDNEIDLIRDLEGLVFDDGYLEKIKNPLRKEKIFDIYDLEGESGVSKISLKALKNGKISKPRLPSAKQKVEYPDIEGGSENLLLLDELDQFQASEPQRDLKNLNEEKVRFKREGIAGMEKFILDPLPLK